MKGNMYNINFEKYLNPLKEAYSDRPVEMTCEPYLDFIDDCKKILDIGCGVGNLVEYLARKGKNAVGMTFNPMEVNEAMSKKRKVILGEMHRLPANDESFDAVVSWDNLEHSIAPFIALSEMKRVLKKNGKLLIFIPSLEWYDNENHFYQLNIKQMKHLINMVGGLGIIDIITREDEDGVYKIRKI